MQNDPENVAGFVARLRRLLPFKAWARPALSASLRKFHSPQKVGQSFIVSSIFDAGRQQGIMCKLEIPDAATGPHSIVVPITQITFGRGCPISREIAAYRKGRDDAGLGALPVAIPWLSARNEMRRPMGTTSSVAGSDRTALRG